MDLLFPQRKEQAGDVTINVILAVALREFKILSRVRKESRRVQGFRGADFGLFRDLVDGHSQHRKAKLLRKAGRCLRTAHLSVRTVHHGTQGDKQMYSKLAWLSRELMTELQYKNTACRSWKHGQARQEKFRNTTLSCRIAARKTKVQLGSEMTWETSRVTRASTLVIKD